MVITTSLALSRLTCHVPNYKEEILALAQARNAEPLYIKFIQKFLAYIPIDYKFRDRKKLFGNLADKAFEFFQNTTLSQNKLEITSTIIEDDPAINILLLNENKPFIVDSIICLLVQHGLQAKFILHPVIASKRDENGQLQEILDVNSCNNAKIESLVYILILGNFDQQALNSLKLAIGQTIDHVCTTSHVWQRLLTRVTNIASAMENSRLKVVKISNQVQYDLGPRDELRVHNNDPLQNELQIQRNAPVQHNYYSETIDFLHWLQNDNFTFLGMVDFDLKSGSFTLEEGVTSIWHNVKSEINDILTHSTSSLYHDQLIILGRINILSPVHRSNLVDYILIKKIDQNGQYHSGSIIFGLYSTAIYYQSISNIPILRQKLKFVLDQANFPFNGYNTNRLRTIVESLPREALIQIDESDLYCMCLHILSSIMSKKLKLFIQQDWSSTFVNIIIFLPKERLTAEIHNVINCYLSEKFASKILSDNITEVAENFSYLFVTLEIQDKSKINFAVELIEQELDQISTRWSEDFYQKLCKKFGEYQASISFKLFAAIFSTDYRQKFNAETALADIEYLKEASNQHRTRFCLIAFNDIEFQLKIYNAITKLALSKILPFIENLGFSAIDEQSFAIKEAGEIKASYICQFTLTALIPITRDNKLLKVNVEEALDKMTLGLLANDSLSKLIVLSGFNWYQVKLVKALTKYLHQTTFTYDKDYVQLTLIKYSIYTNMLVDLFDAKFNPATFSDIRVNNIKNNINNYLNKVTCSSEDKVLRVMFNIIEAMVRTNYYQANASDGSKKNYYSFKFNSQKIPHLPLPRPFAEIFVYGNEFEAIHLRGGKVARGGIRWSDRGEDYRTEILGLMKAQMTKNSVIVPVGSKGGFFLNVTANNLNPHQHKEKAIESYQNFLRGLLDITDNIVDGQIMQPQNTVIYDDEDPYLVVAADKGTATFSDYANNISAEYGFWLGDAFASGGSSGYDHKKMAITAKGAWISVINHFQAMNIDVQNDPITIIGIGDMSGDVFGNGMLRSKTIKLVAAFNHKHIFIDPSPDPMISFNERTRLFNLPTSNWSDYDSKLISKGGGIFERSSKSIVLSAEIKDLLKINKETLSPEDLIKAILQADVDLLWNGGIGTYIKASTESHLEIGDKENDNLRCNAKDIRVKVIAEGGNLGVSQQGRIEFSKYGGKINTDFIDNSAGVDCSDHEVNIKIALNLALVSGKLTKEQRDKLLYNMTEQVEKLVLVDNYKQTQAITIMQLSPALTIGMFSQFIDSLEAASLLDRIVEFLPTKEELTRRSLNNDSITRPELSVLLSYSKMSTYRELVATTFSHDKYFESYLVNYFPQLMQETFYTEILSHPLKHDIIRTVVTNKIINQLGGVLLNVIKRETGAALCDIVRAYIIICEIFNLDNLWQSVESLDNSVDYHIKIDMFTELSKIMRRGILWLVMHVKHPIDISKTISEFADQVQYLNKIIGDLLIGEAKLKFDNKVKQYIESDIENSLACRIAALDSLVSAFDIIYVAKETKAQNIDVANLYFATGDRFNIDWLRKSCDKQINDSYWNRLSIQSLKSDLYDKQRRLLTTIISQVQVALNLDLWIDNNKKEIGIFLDFIKELKLQENIDLNMIILANNKFEMFLRRL